MRSIQCSTVPSPKILKRDVAGFRIIKSRGDAGSSVKVSPNGMPGIVFQHILGTGRHLFKERNVYSTLQLVDSKTTPNVVVIATYQPAK